MIKDLGLPLCRLQGASLLCYGQEEWVVVVCSRSGQVHVGVCAVSEEGLGKPHTTRLHAERKNYQVSS